MKLFVACLACTLIAIAGLSAVALAQTPSTVVDAGPAVASLIAYLTPAAVAAIGALGSWVLVRLKSFLGLKVDDLHRAAIEQGFERAIGFAMSKFGDKARRGIPIDVKNEAIKVASDYVLRAVPQALTHFGKSDSDIADMIEARLEGLLFNPAALAPVIVAEPAIAKATTAVAKKIGKL